jgi:hypothetical protein
MVQIAQDLSKMINKPNPSGWIRKTFQTWKLELDNSRLNQIVDYIEKVRSANKSVTDLQYELFMSPQILSDLINGYHLEAQQKIELQIKHHESALHSIREEMRGRELTNEKVKAEIEQMRAHTRLTELQVYLLQKIVMEVDLNSITPAQAFVLVKALNPAADARVDFASQQLMIEAQLERMKAETAIKIHEGRKEAVKADQARYNLDKSKEEDKKYS